MNRALKASITANVLLAMMVLCLVWKGVRHGQDETRVASPQTVTERNASCELASPATERFRWSQIESSDYRAYIANLRRIGCPEMTIRDIISADVHSLYERQRTQIPRPEGRDLLLPEKVELESELSRLGREEAELVAILLDDNSGRTATPRDFTAAHAVRPMRAGSSMPPELPLVFREPAEGMELNREQSEVIGYLRQKFTEEVGADSQDANDPAYAERWRRAQRDSDDLLAGLLGGEFYLNYQLETSQ